jgi:hypothetical protein
MKNESQGEDIMVNGSCPKKFISPSQLLPGSVPFMVNVASRRILFNFDGLRRTASSSYGQLLTMRRVPALAQPLEYPRRKAHCKPIPKNSKLRDLTRKFQLSGFYLYNFSNDWTYKE